MRLHISSLLLIKTRPSQRQLEPTDRGNFSRQFFHMEVQRVRTGWLLRQLQGISHKEDMEECAYFQWRCQQVGAVGKTWGLMNISFSIKRTTKLH